MAALHQYYETDFSNAVRMHVKLKIDDTPLEAVVLYDFSAFLAFFSCYVSGKGHNLEYFIKLLHALEYGKTQIGVGWENYTSICGAISRSVTSRE